MVNPNFCFVIIGYGKKTSYANGKQRVLDLEETYSLLIKPVLEKFGIPCDRAIDKNLSSSIDKLMLQEIKAADLVIADISTLNPNVMWELGVRHALKPRYTIMICEKEQMSAIPFDINSFVIHQYAHSEEGIPYKEVERFKNHLTDVITKLINQKPPADDSPVFTFLQIESNQHPDMKSHNDASSNATDQESFADLLNKAEEAKNKKDFEKAIELLSAAKVHASANMTLKDNLSFIISRQALCTYKSKKPNELEALFNAKIILDELNPHGTNDLEVLGLSGAIQKRLHELTGNNSYADSAILFYEKGFQIKQDYYNGINATFMLYKKVGALKRENKEWEDAKIKADYIRNAVLEIGLKLEAEIGFLEKPDAIWILLTIAEVYNYKGNTEKMSEYEAKAKKIAEANNDDFAMSSYQEQKSKIALL
jgi:predicted nucleotide-binding protein